MTTEWRAQILIGHGLICLCPKISTCCLLIARSVTTIVLIVLVPDSVQELLRRARAPNKNPNIAVFNRATGEYERPNLNSANPSAMTPATKVSNLKDNHAFDLTNSSKDIDHDANEPEADLSTQKPLPQDTDSHERTITLKRWVPLPQSIADKKPEPKYLADRRPGLPALYGHRAATNHTSTPATGGYAPNISSTLQPLINPAIPGGEVVIGSVTVPSNHATNASGYHVSADGTTMPIGPGIMGSGALSGVQAPAEMPRRRPPPPPPKRKKKGGPGRSKKKVEVAAEVAVKGQNAGGGGSGAAVATQEAIGPGIGNSAVQEADTAQPATGDKRDHQAQDRIDGGGVGDAAESKVITENDFNMGEAAAGEDDENSSTSSTNEDEGSEEGEIDEGDAAVNPTANPMVSAAAALEGKGDEKGDGEGEEEQQARRTAPDVSIQPPSPDLLGNLESEIQGMERGGA